jgi:hypothetical protein
MPTWAVNVPVAVGVKETSMAHEPPAGTGVAVLQVLPFKLKSLE